MKRLNIVISATAFIVLGLPLQAQRGPTGPREPHIGYIYPAGAQRGTVCQITIGGQYLDNMDSVRLSGGGIRVKLLEHEKPMNSKQMAEMRDKLEEAREKVQAQEDDAETRFPLARMRRAQKVAEEAGVSMEDIRKLREFGRARRDPKNQDNPQIGETAVLEIEIAADAELGQRELRLTGAGRLSNPLAFVVGHLPERLEQEPNDNSPDSGTGDQLPIVINGQILPGDVDRFEFRARKGARLVVAAAARGLVPHLADAVPGWFQATMALYDADGKELAYADDYQFDPDPALYYEIPEEGTYVVEIRDAIYRGREDFVYRITLGEVPFVTSIFPLGGRAGARTTVALHGKNLPARTLTVDSSSRATGTQMISTVVGQRTANRFPFAVDDLPEQVETEPNNAREQAQAIELSSVINGRIDPPGDRDVFAFRGVAGKQVVAGVKARRLNSPLDSVLRITDADGQQLAINDDHEDKSAGLVTHHADSLVSVRLPRDGTYYVHLGDIQGKGGGGYAYRLYLDLQRPDFELRVVPSGLNARPGMHVPITVYALRKNGFDGEIALSLKDAPEGFALSGARVPAGQDKIRLTLTTPLRPINDPVPLSVEGRATIGGTSVFRPAVPAEDMMQAFIYRHLVPAEELLVSNAVQKRPRPGLQLRAQGPLELRPGSVSRLEVTTPRRLHFLRNRLEFELSEPPEGVTIENVSIGRRSIGIELRTTRGEAPSASQGNLIVNAFLRVSMPARNNTGSEDREERRVPIGVLPAVPFTLSM